MVGKVRKKSEGKLMLSFGQLLKSKTFWSVVLTFAFNGLQASAPAIAQADPHLAVLVNAIGAGVAIYGRANPRQVPK